MITTDSSQFFSKADTLNADTKTGGTYMYIHSYQIHNVLNDYRKQLSHGPRSNGGKQPTVNETRDRISISKDGQRQSIMDKISSDIVARITNAGPDNQFEAALAAQLSAKPVGGNAETTDGPPEFRYTVIDENNQKQTNTLTIQQFNPSYNRSELAVGNDNGKNRIPESD
jgi:hypothetical protein